MRSRMQLQHTNRPRLSQRTATLPPPPRASKRRASVATSAAASRSYAHQTTMRLAPEDLAVMGHPTITTVNFFTGEAPAAAQLGRRVAATLAANPWLAARLTTDKTTTPGSTIQLSIPPSDTPAATAAAAASCFSELSDPGLSPSTSYPALVAKVSAVSVKTGRACLDRPEQALFRVALVHTQPGAFALIVSMSHVLGDGATYYSVLDGLGKEDPPALSAARVEGFGAALSAAVGAGQAAWKARKSMLLGILFKLLVKAPLGLTPKLAIRAWYVDPAWVEAQKAIHAVRASTAAAEPPPPLPPFVSTNDVLTSWFLKRGAYDYGIMLVDFRRRLPGVGAAAAGNYDGELHYHPDMFATPAGVRAPLLTNFRTGRPCPGVQTNLAQHMAVVTNWASFPFTLDLGPGCRPVLHLPVFETKGVMDACVIFRPTPGTLGVLVADRPGPRSDAADADAALGARIF